MTYSEFVALLGTLRVGAALDIPIAVFVNYRGLERRLHITDVVWDGQTVAVLVDGKDLND